MNEDIKTYRVLLFTNEFWYEEVIGAEDMTQALNKTLLVVDDQIGCEVEDREANQIKFNEAVNYERHVEILITLVADSYYYPVTERYITPVDGINDEALYA